MDGRMQLLGPDGRPVKRQALTTPQATASMAGVRQPFGTSMASGLTPVRLSRILAEADQGQILDFMQLAQEMEERDPHYAAVLGVRKRAVSGVKPVVIAASEDPEDERVAVEVREQIAEHDGFAGLVEDALDALGKGLAVVEIEWRRTSRRWEIDGFEWVDPRFLKVDRETGRELRLLDAADMIDGVPLEPFRFLIHEPKLKSGLPIRGGLARLVAFMWLLKKYDEKDWIACIELFGMPLRLGKYGREATDTDIAALRRAVASIGTDAAAIIPDGMLIEFVKAMEGSGELPYETFARYADEQVSKAVLGQTMTSDNGSSQSQAEVHDSVRHDIAAADARAVSASINRQIVEPWVAFNFGPKDRYPRIMIEVAEPEDTNMILTNATRLILAGVPFKAQELRRKLGFSDPEKGDEIVGGTPAAAPPPPAANRKALNRALPDDDPGPWPLIDELEGELLEGWRDVLEDLLVPIEAQLAQATTLEEARDMIAGIDLPGAPAALTEQLAVAFVKSRGLGDAFDG